MHIGTVRPEEAKVFDSHIGFHSFPNSKGEEAGSFEVFWHEPHPNEGDEPPLDRAGWFWWACFPGCLPDGEPYGPFARSSQAYEDAIKETTDDD